MRNLAGLVVLAVLVNCCLLCCVSASEVNKSSSICQLTVGMDHWAPYQMFEPDGNVKGLQITLVRKIADEIGCELNFTKLSYYDAQQALKKGIIDMQLNAAYTKERARFAHFTSPYRAEFMLLYSTPKYLERCQTSSLQELIRDGFRLAVQNGIAYGPELTKIQNIPELNSKLFYVESSIYHLKLLRENNMDGVVDDPTVVAYRASINSTHDDLFSCPIVVSHEPLSFMLSKKTISRQFVTKMNLAIEKIKQTEYYRSNWVW